MTDYRIDVRGAVALPGMKEGRPRAEVVTVVSIQAIRYSDMGRELKPELLWGPTIFDAANTRTELLQQVAPFFDQVVEAHQLGQEAQLPASMTSRSPSS